MTDTVSSTNSTSLYGSPDTNITLATPTQSSDERSIDSKNFTTLYSNATSFTSGTVNSSVYSVSGGAGISVNPTTGNVVVTNTGVTSIVAGTNISVSSATGAVTVNATDTNTTYNIDASSTTGGANLNLVGSDATTDSVKFAGSGDTTITRTDANTITISSTSGSTIPNGTAKGQVLYWNGSAWTANSTITSAASADRLRVVYENSDAGSNSAIFARKDYTTSTYTTNDGAGIGFQLDSNSQNLNQLAAIYAVWNATAPIISLNTNINDNTTGPFLSVGDFTTAQATLPGDLAVNGGDITTTQTTASLFNTTATTLNIGGAATTVNIAAAYPSTTTLRGDGVVNGILKVLGDAVYINYDDTATDSVLSFKGVSGEYLKWNNTDARFEFSENVLASGWLGAQADVIYINWDNTAIDSYLSFKGINNEYIKWNNTDTRFEFSDQIYNSQIDIPAVLERRSLTVDINTPLEYKSALRLIERVTDAANNDTLAAGPGIIFTRTSGATATTERTFASLGAIWDGATQTVDWGVNWSNDNYSEPTPGNFPGTYTLLQAGSNRSKFLNDSVYIDYAAQGTTHTATSIITSNTLVFGSAHGYTAGDRIIYTSTTQNGLTQDAYYYVLVSGLTATQCQLGLTANGSAVALTNGTGLTLVFADLINQVGINTGSPNYTLDVNGTTNSVGDLTVQAENITINDDKTDANVNLNFGRLGAVNATIRWNSTTDSFEWSADGITWYDFINADLTAPFYNGQLLTYLNGEWVNENIITTTDDTERNIFEYRPLSPTAGVNASLFLRKDFSDAAPGTPGIGTYADGAGVNLSFQVDSDTQGAKTYANITGVYSTTKPTVRLRTSINNGVNFTSVADFTTTDALITGQTLTLDVVNAGAAVDAYFAVNRGSTGADVNIKWNAGTNRWQTTVDGTNYLNIPNQNLDTTDSVTFSNVAIDGQATLDSSTITTTQNTTAVPLNVTARNAMTGLINIIQGANVHCLNYTVLRVDATTALLTTYAEMYNTTSLGSFTADVSGGSLRLLVQPTSASSTVFSVVRTSLT